VATTALFQDFALAAKRIAYRRRNGPNPSGAAHILMDDQPRSATCGWFIRPDADEIGRSITKKAREFGDSHLVRSGLKLDERIVAAERNVCALQ
jgi:hypothetical protein